MDSNGVAMNIDRAAPTKPRQSGFGQKISLLLWKIYLMQKRHYIQTLVEISLPAVLLFPVIYICLYKDLIKSVDYPATNYPELKLDSLPGLSSDPSFEHNLIFCPDNAVFRGIMATAKRNLNELDGVVGVNSLEELQHKMENGSGIAGIEFHHPSNILKIPTKLSYSLRFPNKLRRPRITNPFRAAKETIWNTDELLGGLDLLHTSNPPQPYYDEGFLAIQNAVAKAFIESVDNTKTSPEILLKPFPFPGQDGRSGWGFLRYGVFIVIILGNFFSFSNAVHNVAVEKENQLKEVMKIMGLPNWLLWFSWFTRAMVMLVLSVILFILLLKIPLRNSIAAFPNSNVFLLGLFFVAYIIQLTTLSFLVGVWFPRTKKAMTAAKVIWFVALIPYIVTNYLESPGYAKYLLCIFPNLAMGYGLDLVTTNEEMGYGASWTALTVYDEMTIGTITSLMLLWSVVFMLLTLYIEGVFPGDFGVAKPWYFPCSTNFWNCWKRQPKHGNVVSAYEKIEFDPEHFEKEPLNERAGIEVRKLYKKFPNKFEAVKNLSMNIYNNQITVLLGHNGAGKTTTLSMLTGMIQQTSGKIDIDGHDLQEHTDLARSSMGLCPQHNILFDDLTVREHIVFFACLKGLNKSEANEEVEKYTRAFELDSKVDEMTANLSGGMKRKLSLAIALCGGSKVVFCDEPTSGVDPAARRHILNVLAQEKKDRVILMTTHFMDETEIADRVAIMADGELKCCGSPFFLKKQFGTGYRLICVKNENCNSGAVTALLRSYIPNVVFESENKSEIFYQLPEDQVRFFEPMFSELEAQTDALDLKSFGISLTTMEDVFMKFGTDDFKPTQTGNSLTQISENKSVDPETGARDLNSQGFLLLICQTAAIFMKRFLTRLSDWKSFLIYNLIGLLYFSIVFLIKSQFQDLLGDGKGVPSLGLSLDPYIKPIVAVQHNPNSGDFSTKIMNQYQKYVGTHSPKTGIQTADDMETYLLQTARNSFKEFYFQYLVAASVLNGGTVLGWFNQQFLHTAPLALNLLHNAAVQSFFGSEYEIQVQNAPFKIPEKMDNNTGQAVTAVQNYVTNMMFPTLITFALTLISASYIGFYIKERQCRAKFLQYVSGANLGIFWVMSILWDVLTSLLSVLLFICMILATQLDYWTEGETLTICFFILLFFAFATAPVMCLVSFLFNKPIIGVIVLTILAQILLSVYSVNETLASFNSGFLPDAVVVVMKFYPTITLYDGLKKLANFNGQSLGGIMGGVPDEQVDSESTNRVFAWDEKSVLKDLLYMTATCLIATAFLLIIEHGIIRRALSNLRRRRPPTQPQPIGQLIDGNVIAMDVVNNNLEDDDVSDLTSRINAMSVDELKSQSLVLQNVSKYYGSFLAVNQVSLEIKEGECFGLLGTNGAGKTSIFKMLTGEEQVSDGQAFVQGFNLQSDIWSIYKRIGYCPQFDCLFDDLTARETLKVFALLRGIPFEKLDLCVEQSATDLDFIRHIDKKVSQLSGGNKRKLSTAVALIGSPKVIFLDEPTTGMDPATKRKLWNVVNALRQQGKSIVLTSHSMDECEALCTRLVIMVAGKCKCFGSSQHLKNKFAEGFELKVKVGFHAEDPNANVMAVKQFISTTFPGSNLTEEYQYMLTYAVPITALSWSKIFGLMENGKNTQPIDDYSVSQSSLEQVFLLFVRQLEHSKLYNS